MDKLMSDDPFGIIAKHDRTFGEGSWAEMERGVRARHPEFFAMYDAMEEEPEQERKWWQIWK